MLRPLLLPLALAAMLAASPALAATCNAVSAGPTLSFSFHFGDEYTEAEQNELDLMVLRQTGVDATRVERWGGCLRAFVRDDDGVGEHMEFFHPETFERMD